jgi:hypothetical protein
MLLPPVGAAAAYWLYKHGEDPITQRSIDIGKEYIRDMKRFNLKP